MKDVLASLSLMKTTYKAASEKWSKRLAVGLIWDVFRAHHYIVHQRYKVDNVWKGRAAYIDVLAVKRGENRVAVNYPSKGNLKIKALHAIEKMDPDVVVLVFEKLNFGHNANALEWFRADLKGKQVFLVDLYKQVSYENTTKGWIQVD